MIIQINLKIFKQRMKETKQRVNDHLPEDHQTSKEVRDLEMITHPLNAIHVIRWDILLDIVLLRKISSRRRTKSTIPMQLKKMNQTMKGSQRMKTLVKSMC